MPFLTCSRVFLLRDASHTCKRADILIFGLSSLRELNIWENAQPAGMYYNHFVSPSVRPLPVHGRIQRGCGAGGPTH